jgi:hypothetical protein
LAINQCGRIRLLNKKYRSPGCGASKFATLSSAGTFALNTIIVSTTFAHDSSSRGRPPNTIYTITRSTTGAMNSFARIVPNTFNTIIIIMANASYSGPASTPTMALDAIAGSTTSALNANTGGMPSSLNTIISISGSENSARTAGRSAYTYDPITRAVPSALDAIVII